MSTHIEGNPAPESLEAQALAELEKEGHSISTGQPDANDGDIKDTPAPAAAEKDEQPEEPEPQAPESTPAERVTRTPKLVEAFKLKIAEDQKEKALERIAELEKKMQELSSQKSDTTTEQQQEIDDDIAAIAEETGADPKVLSKLANAILKKAQPNSELERSVKELAEQREIERQRAEYSAEFEKDVLPLLGEKYQLSDTALRDIKSKLEELAFSETYANVPLVKILRAEEDDFGIKPARRSSEGGNRPRVRQNNIVDLEGAIDEESFSKLPDSDIEKFLNTKRSSSWNARK